MGYQGTPVVSGTYAYRAAGHDVAFVARGETLRVLGETGVTLIDAHAEPTTTEIAKDYGLSAKKLNQILRGEQVQFHQPGRWFLYAKFTEKGYTQSKTYEYDEGKTCTHMYWTQKGRLFIYDLLKNIRGLLPVVEREGEDAR